MVAECYTLKLLGFKRLLPTLEGELLAYDKYNIYFLLLLLKVGIIFFVSLKKIESLKLNS